MNIKRLFDDFNEISTKYSELNLSERENCYVISGILKIFNDFYEIKIKIPDNYPLTIPTAFEIGGRIPKIAERHINTADGSLCLCVPCTVYQYFEHKNNFNIIEYINKLLVPFLANQSYYERNGEWVNGDYYHGIKGIIQFYYEQLSANDINTIIRSLEYINNPSSFEFNKKCYCKSGKIFEKCHQPKCLKLEKLVDSKLLKQNMIEIKKIIKISL